MRREYFHDRTLLNGLLGGLRTTLREEGIVRVVVEEAAGARLIDGEHSIGRIGYRRKNEIDGARYERVGRAYRFSYPADKMVDPEISDDAGAHILAIFPGSSPEDPGVFILQMEPPPEGERITRRVVLAPLSEDSEDSDGDTPEPVDLPETERVES